MQVTLKNTKNSFCGKTPKRFETKVFRSIIDLQDYLLKKDTKNNNVFLYRLDKNGKKELLKTKKYSDYSIERKTKARDIFTNRVHRETSLVPRLNKLLYGEFSFKFDVKNKSGDAFKLSGDINKKGAVSGINEIRTGFYSPQKRKYIYNSSMDFASLNCFDLSKLALKYLGSTVNALSKSINKIKEQSEKGRKNLLEAIDKGEI